MKSSSIPFPLSHCKHFADHLTRKKENMPKHVLFRISYSFFRPFPAGGLLRLALVVNLGQIRLASVCSVGIREIIDHLGINLLRLVVIP